MKPLLLLALALAAPGFAEDRPPIPRDGTKLKMDLAKDFAGGASLKENRRKWLPDEIKAGAALEPLIARGIAVQEIAAAPADIGAYEKEVNAVAIALGHDEAGAALVGAKYLFRLKGDGRVALTAEQRAAIDERLGTAKYTENAEEIRRRLAKLQNVFGDARRDLQSVGPNPGATLSIGAVDARPARAAAIGAEVTKVKAEQAGLAARYNPDLRVPSAGDTTVKKDDAPWYAFWRGEDSTLGRLGRSVRGVPGVGSALDFVGGTGSTLYTGVVSVPGATGVLREETQDRSSYGTAPGTLWSGANVIGESAPFLMIGPAMSASTRLLQLGQRSGTAAAVRALPMTLIDPASLFTRDQAPGAVITVKRVDTKAANDGVEPEPER